MGTAPKISVSLLLIILLIPAQTLFAWTNKGHTSVNRVAAQKIPVSMPLFLRRAVTEIGYLGPEADRWRDPGEWPLAASQAPDHFIKLERISWIDPMPRDRYEFYRQLCEKRATSMDHSDDYLPENVGLQPYIVAEVYGRLKLAFREYRSRQASHEPTLSVQQVIIFYAGWLGHYVADGSQPLHTSIQIDGWVGPNPQGYATRHGIHAMFEAYADANITASDFASQVHAPERLADPFADYMDYLRHSNRQVESVYMLEKAGGFTGKGTRQAFDFTKERLAAGTQMLLDLWYTAWVTSVEPAKARESHEIDALGSSRARARSRPATTGATGAGFWEAGTFLYTGFGFRSNFH
jgi:hypothetical protein